MPWTNTKPNGEDARCAVCGLSGMYDGYGRQAGVPKPYQVWVVALEDRRAMGPADQVYVHNTCVTEWLFAHPTHALQNALA